MYAKVNSATLCGIDAVPVEVETDVSDGMPVFEMVGVLSGEVREARERVRTALKNIGLMLPVKRITVNFLPADIKKMGSGFDLPVAVSVLSAVGVIPKSGLEELFVAGELGLDGRIHPISGILPMVIGARSSGFKSCILPAANVKEASLVPDMQVVGVNSMSEVIDHFAGRKLPEIKEEVAEEEKNVFYPDFGSINGQAILKRACEVAAAGRHNLLMIGSPGAGKSMAAKCIPGILPPMTKDEMLEVSKIYSVCGLFAGRDSLIENRPFRSPHHTVSTNGLTGGGSIPKPGEISLAHKGVLFLDELPEFRRDTLEVMRQPLEDKKIHVVRTSGDFVFPADFMLVAAMNPCKCGLYPQAACRCTARELENYLGRISQPLLDRIDICVEAKPIRYNELVEKMENESSQTIRKRVVEVTAIQSERFKNETFSYNSQIPGDLMERYCGLGVEEKEFMEEEYDKGQMSARTYHKLLRVARTVADLCGSTSIKKEHIFEALQYKSADKKYWSRRNEYEFGL